MGMFSRLFGGEDGATASAADTNTQLSMSAVSALRTGGHGPTSLSATVTGGFISAKRVLAGIVQPGTVARTSTGEALWIPLQAHAYHEQDAPARDPKQPPPLPTQRTQPITAIMGSEHAPLSPTAQAFIESFSLLPADTRSADAPHGLDELDELDELDDLVSAAVDALFDPTGRSALVDTVNEHAADRAAVLETFAAVAREHGRPLRELMFQLAVGSTPRSWAQACRPLLHPLQDAAEQIGCTELAEALQGLEAALADAVSAGVSDEPIDAAASATIHAAYEQLRVQLPDVFSPSSGGDSRRRVLFESLLLQLPALHRRTIAKLYAAGLSTITQLSRAEPDELSVVVHGLDRELARAIIEHLQRFERERVGVDPASLRGHVHARMRNALGKLGQLQVEFERSESDADHHHGQPRKKAVRRAREAAVLELQRLLAELGDLALIEELKRLPVRAKLRRLHTYLETQVPT